MAAPIVGILSSILNSNSNSSTPVGTTNTTSVPRNILGPGGDPASFLYDHFMNKGMRNEQARQFDENIALQRDLAKAAMAQDNYNASRNRQAQGFDALAGLRNNAQKQYFFSK
jgi:hypothetical protein